MDAHHPLQPKRAAPDALIGAAPAPAAAPTRSDAAGGSAGGRAAPPADPRLLVGGGAQRALLLQQLQRAHGNAHVARLIARSRAGAPAGGAIQRDCPPPAVELPPVAPRQDPDFAATAGKVGQAAKQEAQHTPAATKAAQTQAAAVGPPNEVASQAKAGQVDKMGRQEPGVFDKPAFVAAVRAAVAAATPKNLDEAEKYASSGKAAQIKGQVGGLVGTNKAAAEQSIKTTANEAPDAGKAAPKPVTPATPEAVGPSPGPVGADRAMPDAKTPAETDLRHEQCATDEQMKEAGVSEEQLKKSNEPKFQAALEAKQEADAHTAAAPKAFKAEEGAILGDAKAQASGAAAGGLAGMHAGRAAVLGQVAGQQAAGKAADEAKRAAVAADPEAIYGRTKAEVTQILDGVEGTINPVFDAGEKAAREAMETFIVAETKEFNRRRSLLQLAIDWFDKPPELDRIIDRGVKLFLERMDGVIGRIADIVGAELTRAKARIAQGRQEIAAHVAGLPRDLQAIGKELQAGFGGKFEELSGQVDARRDAIVDGLAQKYAAARDAANERASAMKAANKGLWDRAKEAVGETLATIMQLKDMLLGVLAKAAGVIDKIIADPIEFLGKLVSAIKQGLSGFVANIGKHLQKGLMGWLFGTLAEAGIQLPESFDLKGILSLVLQLLGVTYANIRARAATIVGEKAVAALEKTVDIFKTLATEGVAGLWKFIQDKLAGLKDQVLDQIKDFVITKIVTAGVTWLMSLLNPASAFVRACKMIYDVVMFFVERGSQIMGLVNAVLDGVGQVASGAIGGAAKLVEEALGRAVPIAISFLASLLGLGGIAGKIKSVFEAIQAPVNQAIDAVIGGALKLFKKLGGDKLIAAAQKGVAWTKDKIKQGKEWVKKQVGELANRAKKAFYGGSEEDKQARLKQGMAAGVAAIDAVTGDTAPGTMVKAKLASLRLRYRLPVLEPIVRDGRWHVRGEIQRVISPTKKQAPKAPPDPNQGHKFVIDINDMFPQGARGALVRIVKTMEEATNYIRQLVIRKQYEGLDDAYSDAKPYEDLGTNLAMARVAVTGLKDGKQVTVSIPIRPKTTSLQLFMSGSEKSKLPQGETVQAGLQEAAGQLTVKVTGAEPPAPPAVIAGSEAELTQTIKEMTAKGKTTQKPHRPSQEFVSVFDQHSETAVWQEIKKQDPEIAEAIEKAALTEITSVMLVIHSERFMCPNCVAASRYHAGSAMPRLSAVLKAARQEQLAVRVHSRTSYPDVWTKDQALQWSGKDEHSPVWTVKPSQQQVPPVPGKGEAFADPTFKERLPEVAGGTVTYDELGRPVEP